ncbi:AIR synthase family protein [soil metagenome]
MEKLGKIEHTTFENFISERCGLARKEVIAGPAFGVDVSVVDLGQEKALISTSDPLSLIPSLGLEESAWLSVHLMANDIATTGFSPMYAQFVLNLPPGLSRNDFGVYWNYIHQFCKEIGVAITGGHTGFIEEQNSTIAGGGTFFSIAPRHQIHISKNAQPSDMILVTKHCAISSSAILAMSFPDTVINKLGKEVFEEGQKLFYQTSSLRDALTAAGETYKHPEITAMHDVTEGGVLGAIYELATASSNGALIDNEKLPVEEAVREICNLFSLDPRYCIGAGAMIITCKSGEELKVVERLKKENINCTVVGQMMPKEAGFKIIENGSEQNIDYKEEDPYWAAFFKAFKAGWK